MTWPKKFIFLLSIFCFQTSVFSIDWNVDQNGNWNVSTNWNPATVPNTNVAIASFPNILTQPRIVTVDGTFSVGTLNFLSFNSYTVSGGTLDTFSSININAPDGAHVITSELALQGNVTITNTTGTPFTISGIISGANQLIVAQGTVVLSGVNTYTGGTTVSGTAVLEGTTTSIQGNVTDNATLNFNQGSNGTYAGNITGTGDVILAGGGVVSFTGVNGYSGETKLNAGTLQVTNINQLGTGIRRFNGGALQASTSPTITDPVNIALDGNGTYNIDTGTTLDLTGVISGAGALIKIGGGTFDLGPSNHTYTGGTQIGGGILRINVPGNLSTGQVAMNNGTLNSTANMTLTNTFVLDGPSTIDPVAATTLTMNGTVNGAGLLIKAGGGILDMGAGANSYSGGTDVNDGTLQINAAGNLGSGLITFNGATLNSTTTFTENNNILINATNGIFSVDAATTLTLSGTISGPGALINSGAGSLNLGSNTHTYSGGTQLNAGTVIINQSGNLGTNQVTFNGGTLLSTGNITITNSAFLNAVGTFSTNPGTTLTWNGPITGGGTLTKIGTGTLILGATNSYGGNTVTAGTLQGTTSSISGNVANNGATLVFSQNFNGSYGGMITGTGDLVKQGNGTVTLTNTNSYSGDTFFNNGTIQISNINQIGVAPGTRIFNGGALQTTANITDTVAYSLVGNGTLIPSAGTTLDLSGATILGAGTLIMDGAGTLNLQNAHGYTGGTRLDRGIVLIDNNNSLGTGPITFDGGTLNNTANVTLSQNATILSTGTINTDAGTTLDWSGSIGGSGELIKQGPGTLLLSGTNNYSGGTNLAAGTIEGTTNGIQGNIINNGILNFNQGFAGTYSGSISGGGSVQINGAGPVTFSGTNSYNGGTTISLGSTLIGTTNSLQGAIANAGTLTFDQNFNGTFHGTISGAGALFKEGSGTTRFNGNQPFTGLTTINGGIFDFNGSLNGDVQVNSGGFFSGNNQVNNLTNDGTVVIAQAGTIGQIDVIGTYTQGAGGSLLIDVDSFGNTDVLNATVNATLDGSLQVNLLPGVYDGSETYIIVTAPVVAPGFSSLTSSVGAPVFVIYPGTFAQINVAFRGSVLPVPIDILPPNAKSVAEYLFCPGFSPENPDLFYVMNTLLNLPPDEFVKELEELGPAIFGALPLTDLQSNHLIADTMVENTATYSWCEDCTYLEKCPNPRKKTVVWLTPVGQWQKQRGYDEQTGFLTRTYGVGLGATHYFHSWIGLGGGVGYTYTDLGWKEDHGEGHWHSIYAGPSFGLVGKNCFFNLLAQGSVNFYSIDRKVTFPGLNRTAHNNHHSFGILGRMDAGYKITFVPLQDHPLSLIPTLRVSYLNIFEEGYTETGANSINLKVDRKTTSYLQPEFLVKFLREVYFSKYCFSSAIQLGWIGNIPLSSANYTSRFNVDETFCKPNFSVATFDRFTNQMTFGLDFVLKRINLYQIGLSYEGKAFDRLFVNTAKIHVDWKF